MVFKVGDPDPTPKCESGMTCMEMDPETKEYCTWRNGMPGDNGMHVAGNGSTIVAVWPIRYGPTETLYLETVAKKEQA